MGCPEQLVDDAQTPGPGARRYLKRRMRRWRRRFQKRHRDLLGRVERNRYRYWFD